MTQIKKKKLRAIENFEFKKTDLSKGLFKIFEGTCHFINAVELAWISRDQKDRQQKMELSNNSTYLALKKTHLIKK